MIKISLLKSQDNLSLSLIGQVLCMEIALILLAGLYNFSFIHYHKVVNSIYTVSARYLKKCLKILNFTVRVH